MMQNGFMLARCVFFALLILLTILTLSFASWNIHSSSHAGLTTSTTSGIIIFESCAFFLCSILAFLEAFRPKANTSCISLECSWVAVLALFQLGSAISATINAPVFACRPPASADMCASASLLVPSMWSKSLLSFGYFFALFIAALAHRRLSENIWKETVYSMAWFQSRMERTPVVKKMRDDPEKADRDWDAESVADDDAWFRQLAGIGSSSERKKQQAIRESTETAAPWAQNAPIRRGVDKPFSLTSAASTPASIPHVLPPVPLKAANSKSSSSRFIEKFRESRVLSRFEIPSLYGSHFMSNNNDNPAAFPSSIDDHDKPIPLPRLSEWVRADDIKR